ncbi:condensin subunit ScpA [Hypnocyclicus thermotrophus]|uniref:Segregation and condensation protein A n=1 Tax=Hypnocyclicus thermotrophus TaxID=1627895 RepID=A0AA46DZM8_9FUSO|nr:ScpA family protein [Hypnocyclicus thermotrophus]TDT71447.1 condensin subunit ScpA [Hypnocyclicus thermotrophus]
MNNDINVKIENFEGPLDLLLHLINKKKLNITEINILELIETYLEIIEKLEIDNIPLKADFLAMAADLLEIKALSVLNYSLHKKRKEELSIKLLEYQQYVELSQLLKEKENEYNISFTRAGLKEINVENNEVDLSDLTLEKLFIAYKTVVETSQKEELKIVVENIYSLEDEIEKLIKNIENNQKINYINLFQSANDKMHRVYLFLAILELYRYGKIDIKEDKYIVKKEN